MNLKYFRNEEGDYIIYRETNSQEPDNFIYSQSVYITFSILPKNSSTAIENFFDKNIPEIIQRNINELHLDSTKDLSTFTILANYENLDEENSLFKNRLDLKSIDNENTFYKFLFISNMELPLTKNSFLKNPELVIKSIFNTIFHK